MLTSLIDIEISCAKAMSGDGASSILLPAAYDRFTNLGIYPKLQSEPDEYLYPYWGPLAKYLTPKIGCMVSAVEFLHSKGIRHKDIKPSNILLGPESQLWLTDFGTATDFSQLSTSCTENGERGTPKYFAPEVAEYLPSGRAADMFSLGCVLVEVLTIQRLNTLERLRSCRPTRDGSFQANLESVSSWLLSSWFQDVSPDSSRRLHLILEIRQLLEKEPGRRPTARQLCYRLSAIDTFDGMPPSDSLFGECCRTSSISLGKLQEELQSKRSEGTLPTQRWSKEESSCTAVSQAGGTSESDEPSANWQDWGNGNF
jgi:serine/threonine protein kinase